MAKKFTLHKSERLKSRKSIEHLFKSGRSLSKFPFKVVFILSSHPNEQEVLKAGFSASTRNFKKAVDRNRIKRQIKETYRLQKLPLCQALRERHKRMDVFFIYTGKVLPEYELLFSKMNGILQSLTQIVYDEITA